MADMRNQRHWLFVGNHRVHNSVFADIKEHFTALAVPFDIRQVRSCFNLNFQP